MNKKIEKKNIPIMISFRKKLSLYRGYAFIILSFALLFSSTGTGLAGLIKAQQEEKMKDKPLIFPIPSEVQINKGVFSVDKSVFIMVPDNESKSNDVVVKLLFNEFIDKYEQTVNIVIKSSFTEKDRFILIGDITNPLVKDYCEKKGLLNSLKELGTEGYILSVSGNNVVIAANSKKGTLFGFESLRQIINEDNGNLFIPQLIVKDAPQFPFRGIKVYLPGRENITFFKRFIKDFVALYKYNTIVLELNANMRLDRHPELNIGAVEFYRHLNFSRLDRPPGMHQEFQNSSHQDNADGGILEKEEVADIVNYMRKFNIEVIPELPSLTHAYYLLAGHKDLAENPEQPYPDTYCPLKPENYKIYFDVLDEYIDVIHPYIIHIGHDEWRMEKNKCALCRGKDYGQLYADDVTKIHDYLAKKGIKTALWGDHLLESVTHKDHQEWESSTGYKYNIPGALTPEQVKKSIPKDILVFNWFWNDINNDKQVSDFGFNQVYGNFTPDIEKWNERTKIKGLMGGVPSSWAGTTEKNFGKDQVYDFLGAANLLWSKYYLPEKQLALITNALTGDIRINFRGKILPGESGVNVSALDISSHFNSSLTSGIDSLNISDLLTGSVKAGSSTFNLNSPSDNGKRAIVVVSQKAGKKTTYVEGIEINKDVNSIIFLHACAKAGINGKAYQMIYNFDETAELLGWYEIVYDDGFVENIPIRYGINILDWKWNQRIMNNIKDNDGNSQKYAYDATSIICSKENSDPVTFFSFEWENIRQGKKITRINLRSVTDKLNNGNAVILMAICISEKSEAVAAQGTEKE